MARSKLPDPLRRRHLLEQQLAPEQALRTAEAYRAEGRSVEAVDFLRKAQAAGPLAELAARAVEQGDTFLLRAVAAAGVEVTAAQWRALAQAAEAAGKERYAAEARRWADREGG